MTESPSLLQQPRLPRAWLWISAASFFFCARAAAKIKSPRVAFSSPLRRLASGQTADGPTLLPPAGSVGICRIFMIKAHCCQPY